MLPGLLVCALLLGVSVPTLLALPSVPTRILAGDEYAISQGKGPPSVNASLAANLTAQPWAEAVSPEILALTTLGGEPVVVRGAEPDAFLAMEAGSWIRGSPGNVTWAALGDALATRLGVSVGDAVTLTGSSSPRIAIAFVSGVYRTSTQADDEVLVGLGLARFLTGLGPSSFHTIRVKTLQPDLLVSFLDHYGASVRVTGPGTPEAGANTNTTLDPRLVNLYLLHGIGNLPADYLAEGVAEVANSVRVVAWGLVALVGVLVAFGLHAVQARSFEDRRRNVAVLRTLGAKGRWVAVRALGEILPMALVSGLAGGGLGLFIAVSLPPTSTLLVLGHAVRVSFDPLAYAAVVAAVVLTSAVSEVLLVRAALRDRPAETLREAASTEPPVSLEVVLRS